MSNPMELVLKELSEIKSWQQEKMQEGLAPVHDEIKRMGDRLEAVTKGYESLRRERLAHMDNDGRMIVREGRFSGFDAVELAIARNLGLSQIRGSRPGVSPEFLEDLSKAQNGLKAVMVASGVDTTNAWMERCLKQRIDSLVVAGVIPPGISVFRDSLTNWRTQMLQLTRKALDSTTAASGDELVPTLEAAQLWMDVNLETKILPLFIQSPMPTNPFDIPGQLGDVNWYPTAENEQGTTTTVSTKKTTLTAYELKAGIPFSDTLEEDAIITLIPELRAGLVRNAAQIIDDVLLNGDTTTTNGINSDGATISKTTAGKAHWLLGFDGLIHQPLIDRTASKRALASTLAASVFNNNMLKMAKYASPGRRGDVFHVSDVNTAIAALILDEVETLEKYGLRATISTGELASIYGIPYIMSEQMKLADADGKVTDSGGNTTGRILTTNATQWRVGFRRAITFEADREPGKSQTTLYVSFRIAFTERTGTRSTATHTALQHDISSVT